MLFQLQRLYIIEKMMMMMMMDAKQVKILRDVVVAYFKVSQHSL
jgi:hypothetical protein